MSFLEDKYDYYTQKLQKIKFLEDKRKQFEAKLTDDQKRKLDNLIEGYKLHGEFSSKQTIIKNYIHNKSGFLKEFEDRDNQLDPDYRSDTERVLCYLKENEPTFYKYLQKKIQLPR